MENPKLEKEIIDLFERVQNIPFGFSKDKAVCSEKHFFLAKEFKRLGIPVKFLLVKFSWKDLPISKEVEQAVDKQKNPFHWHVALKIKPRNKWIHLDATWDLGLKESGLPVVEQWDGKSDTKLAVKPIRIIEIPFFMHGILEFIGKRVRDKHKGLQKALSKWIEQKRRE